MADKPDVKAESRQESKLADSLDLGRLEADAAMREFQAAIALNPENANAHFNLAVMLGPRNQLDEAIAHLRRVVEINPLHADAYHNLSVAYGLQRRLDDAIAAAQAAVRLKPDSAVAQQQLQQLLAARNR